LITGTSPNIGGGIAEGLSEVGAKVVCVDIHPENASQGAAAIVKRGGQAIGSVAMELVDYGIRVNSLTPSYETNGE
jgi:NAD(P)-dependent dehydrogenase (short-subunit alcohol dehydrogenase family)